MSLRQLTLDREVTLVSIGVFKVLLHVQRERQHWSKARERLIVESLPAELILRSRSNTRRNHTSRTNRRYWSTWRTHCSLKHLHAFSRAVCDGTARRQNSLLLLHCISDVRVERDRQQRMVVENSEGGANRRLSIVPSDPTQRPGAAPSCSCRAGILAARPSRPALPEPARPSA